LQNPQLLLFCSTHYETLFGLQNAYNIYKHLTETEDKCAAASETFQCGLSKDPNLVNSLISDNKGAASTVYNMMKIKILESGSLRSRDDSWKIELNLAFPRR